MFWIQRFVVSALLTIPQNRIAQDGRLSMVRNCRRFQNPHTLHVPTVSFSDSADRLTTHTQSGFPILPTVSHCADRHTHTLQDTADSINTHYTHTYSLFSDSVLTHTVWIILYCRQFLIAPTDTLHTHSLNYLVLLTKSTHTIRTHTFSRPTTECVYVCSV